MRVVRVLHERYGSVPPRPVKDPLGVLVQTLLSHNTNDRNRDIAFERLRGRFPDWDSVRRAPTREIIAAVKPAGLANTKAPRIKRLLEWLHDTRGELSLEFLHELDDDAVIETLGHLSGVGLKTVTVLLAMAMGRDHCPVDTHVWRVSARLALVPSGLSRDETYFALREVVPPGVGPGFHLDLLAFGRDLCTARAPECPICPFVRWCPYAKSQPR